MIRLLPLSCLLVLTMLAPPARATSPEPSVRPGANQQYLQTDISEWITRFEGAGREIYDHRNAIVAASGLRPGMQVADVGAGTGLFSLLFARAVGPSGRVYAYGAKTAQHGICRAGLSVSTIR